MRPRQGWGIAALTQGVFVADVTWPEVMARLDGGEVVNVVGAGNSSPDRFL